MFCTNCGKKNPEQANFCFACGSILPTTLIPSLAANNAPEAGTTDIGAAQLVVRKELGATASPEGRRGASKRCPSCGLPNRETAERCGCGYSFVAGNKNISEANAAAVEYAGFWKRVLASLADGLVTTVLSMVIALVVGGALWLSTASAQETVTFTIVYYLAIVPVHWLYYALMESSSRQATYGKVAVGIVVTDLQGNRISFGRATSRSLLKFVNTVTLGVGWILAGLTSKKQALHDLLAGTVVVARHSPNPMLSPLVIPSPNLSGYAIAAGYAGLFALLILPSPVALALGIVAFMDIHNNGKRGRGRATFGLICGSLGTVVLGLMMFSLLR
jgi:uncharacterized RDD family membrane protein YckC